MPDKLLALLGEIVPLFSSLIVFFVLIKLLPTTSYGTFVAVTGSAMIVSPLARAGAPVVMLRALGAGEDRQESWDDAFNATAAGSFVAVASWILLAPIVLPTAPYVASVLLFSQQLVPLAFSELCNAIFVGRLEMADALVVRTTFSVWRVVGLLGFATLRSDSLLFFALALAVASLFGAVQNIYWLRRRTGLMSRLRRTPPRTLVQGLPDSFSAATGSVLDSIDRPLLYNAGFEEDTARYGAAMRLVSLAGIPTVAILRPFDKELFGRGSGSIARATKVMVRATKQTVPASLAAAAALWLISGALSSVLPDDYAEATDIIRWGVWMIPMRAISFPFGNALTASGFRTTRLWITVVAALGNTGANLVLIPAHSWRAAVGTTLAAEAFMALATAGFCFGLSRRTSQLETV